MTGNDGVSQPSRFLRAATVVGDLDSPFYDEERRRDVWNEASAVGLQVVLWLGMAIAAGMVWLGGTDALPYAFSVYALVGVASVMALRYANELGVLMTDRSHLVRLRMVPYLVLVIVFLWGVVRALPSEGLTGGLKIGLVAGGVAGVLGVFIGARRDLRP